MPKDKKPSKRVPLKRKYTIEKKVKDHHKKVKKFAKSQDYKKKFRPGMRVPSSCPFKKEVLEAIQNVRDQAP